MILTKEAQKSAADFVQKTLPAAARERILYSAVKLFTDGFTPAGQNQRKLGDFNGSGVIVNVKETGNKKVVTILTALHNVMVWCQSDALPSADLINKFAAATTIKWVESNIAFNSEPIKGTTTAPVPGTQIADLCGQRANCCYDLLVLECEDPKLYDFALKSVFAQQTDPLTAEAKDIKFLDEQLLDSGKYHHLQLGYGVTSEARKKQFFKAGKLVKATEMPTREDATKKSKLINTAASKLPDSEMTRHHLHYRLTMPKAKTLKSVYEQTADVAKTTTPAYLEYVSAFLHMGKRSSTSAPGDSGGPLYAISKVDPSSVYLLGVTSGADMAVGKVPAMRSFKNCVSTSVIPYMRKA